MSDNGSRLHEADARAEAATEMLDRGSRSTRPDASPPNRFRRHRRVHRTAWLVLIMGLVVGVLASSTARHVANGDENRLLVRDTALTAQEVSALVGQAQSSLGEILAVVSATDANRIAFGRAADDPNSFFSSWVVERQTGLGWATVLTLKADPALLGEAQNMSSGLGKSKPNTFRIFGFLGSGNGRLLVVAERDDHYLAFADLPFPESQVVSSAASNSQYLVSGHEQFALYLGRGEQLSDAIISSSPRLPLTGHRAVVLVDTNTGEAASNPRLGTKPGSVTVPTGDLMLVVSARSGLAGHLALDLPWILLVVIGLAALAMTVAVELVLRRRDDALSVVAGLEETNRAKDRALSEQAQAEKERQEMEVQLRGAQRMEAVGNLAGGVAHDFNNLLAVILNYAQFAAEQLEGHPAQQELDEIVGAARRAADLTRQLLVFSRRDIIDPRVIDLNQVVTGIQRLLGRTIGEDIALETVLASNLPSIKADEGELEQVVMNLAINSRDAIADSGGWVIIRTGQVDLTEEEANQHPDLVPGRYVSLAVSDNGAGMSDEVLARAFDPFFTTKPIGQGTGLGLATVYGIAKRWAGDVQIRSKEGAGTEVTVLFPASSDSEWITASKPAIEPPRTGNATVLLVEDQDGVRRAARRILEQGGYRVVEAADGVDALARTDLARIDLLLTDVVMPGGLSGHDLAQAVQERCPRVRVLYMSGYTAEIIARRGILEEGLSLLQKPFDAESLLVAVAAALDLVANGAAV